MAVVHQLQRQGMRPFVTHASTPPHPTPLPTPHPNLTPPLHLPQAFLASLSDMSCFAAIIPLASTTMSTQGEIYAALAKAVDIYSVVLTFRVLLTWFRQIDWTSDPWATLRQLTDPYLNIFRGIIPPLGGIDLSPILAFFLLSFASKGLKSMAWAI
jgi:YggT family protein